MHLERSIGAGPAGVTANRCYSPEAFFKDVVGFCFLMLISAACTDQSQDTDRLIQLADSFVTDAKLSKDRNVPIVVFVSQHGCEYCAVLRKQVLFPMMRAGEIEGRAVLRELSLDHGFTVEDFSGYDISGKAFASRYAAVLTPTLIFLGSNGDEVAEKLVGIGNIEYYGFYLNQSIDKAAQELAGN